MRERAAPFLIFADLAFFLFAVLVLSYQYVRVIEAGDNTVAASSFLLDLVHLPFSDQAHATEKKTQQDRVKIAVLRDGTILVNEARVAGEGLISALSAHKDAAVTLLVDRHANAEPVVLVLGALERHKTGSIEIEFIAEGTSGEDGG